jgi:hypothetical protein
MAASSRQEQEHTGLQLPKNSVKSLLLNPFERRTLGEKLCVKELGPEKPGLNLTQQTQEKGKTYQRSFSLKRMAEPFCVCLCVCVCHFKRIAELLRVCVLCLNVLTFWRQRKSMKPTEEYDKNKNCDSEKNINAIENVLICLMLRMMVYGVATPIVGG